MLKIAFHKLLQNFSLFLRSTKKCCLLGFVAEACFFFMETSVSFSMIIFHCLLIRAVGDALMVKLQNGKTSPANCLQYYLSNRTSVVRGNGIIAPF